MVIPPQPEQVKDIEPAGVFFTLRSGENITKLDADIQGDENRRILGFSSDKVLEAAMRMSKAGIMDATFKVHLRFISTLMIDYRLHHEVTPSCSSSLCYWLASSGGL